MRSPNKTSHSALGSDMKRAICSVALLLACAAAEFQCPSRNGYFPDPEQCDMYYECRRGVASPKLCADGMAFHDGNPLYARCDFLRAVDCSRRPYLQNAKSSLKCPRANGFFPHEEYPRVCHEFYSCNNGVASKLSCPKGLAFSTTVGSCEWAARVPGCEHQVAEEPQEASKDEASAEE